MRYIKTSIPTRSLKHDRAGQDWRLTASEQVSPLIMWLAADTLSALVGVCSVMCSCTEGIVSALYVYCVCVQGISTFACACTFVCGRRTSRWGLEYGTSLPQPVRMSTMYLSCLIRLRWAAPTVCSDLQSMWFCHVGDWIVIVRWWFPV